jgi:RNA polymerase sigma-70 factor (ECF subfamily)
MAAIPDALRSNAPLPASNLDSEGTCTAESDPLAAVVRACQSNNYAAQRRLYDATHQSVFRLAVRMVGLQNAADMTQQVFLQAFRSLDKFNGRSRFETWLYRLAVNESLQFLRRNRHERHQPLDWEPMDESQPGEIAGRKELLDQALARIDPDLRAIFLLREVERLSYRDIAKALQIPEGTVGSRLNRARRELQQHLADLGYEP